jgi:hypothetical protein
MKETTMAKFILVFRGGMPKSPEEGQKMMAAWNAWMDRLGPALVDPGAGVGKSHYRTAPGQAGTCPSPISGYSVVEAADIAAALQMADTNPIFGLGGTIEVAEAMQM